MRNKGSTAYDGPITTGTSTTGGVYTNWPWRGEEEEVVEKDKKGGDEASKRKATAAVHHRISYTECE